MNGYFDRYIFGINLKQFRLANTYGAFGSVPVARDELVVQGSSRDMKEWKEYRFEASPSLRDTRCRQISPWHIRLDWQKWISARRKLAALNEQWFIAFLLALLRNDTLVTALLKENPFSSGEPPAYLRVLVFRYKFAPPGTSGGALWTREEISTLLRPVTLQDLTNTS